jgi:hypothetical protein
MTPMACRGNVVALLRKTAFLCSFDDPASPSNPSGHDRSSPSRKGEAMSFRASNRLSAACVEFPAAWRA